MGRIENSRMRAWQFAGPPASGTAGTFAGSDLLEAGALLWDVTNGVLYVNEGTGLSPYWTPTSINQRALFGVDTDFRDSAGKAISDTALSALLAGSGLRIFGQGVNEVDAGLVVQAAAEGGSVARIITSATDAHVLAIGMAAGVMQPDQHGQLVVDVQLTMVSAITARAMFVGFIGTAADALDPAVTGATTVATFVQADLAGLWMDAGLTDGDRLFGVHDKSAAAGTQDLTADGDTGVDLAAAGTEQRFRVEIGADGNMRAFVDKVLVYSQAIALDVDEECSPVVYLESQASATKSADVRRVSMWANR
jgi:hypothetical protein